MKLIVGLGNPGRNYQGSRHNVGFDVLDEILRKSGRGGDRTKFEGRLADAELGGERVTLLWPQTFMNLSGMSVGKVRDFYKIETPDILVICDDFNLPLARLRLRATGSSGGQKGLADILRRLGTEEIARLRVGVGPVPDGRDAADFVLGKFKPAEGTQIEQAVWRAADAATDWVQHGIQFAMNKYNKESQEE